MTNDASQPGIVERYLAERPSSHLKRDYLDESAVSIRRFMEAQIPGFLHETLIKRLRAKPIDEDPYLAVSWETNVVLERYFRSTQQDTTAHARPWPQVVYENKINPSHISIVTIDETLSEKSSLTPPKTAYHMFVVENYGQASAKTTKYMRLVQTGSNPAVLEYASGLDAGTDPRGIATPDNPLPDPETVWKPLAPKRRRPVTVDHEMIVYRNIPTNPASY